MINKRIDQRKQNQENRLTAQYNAALYHLDTSILFLEIKIDYLFSDHLQQMMTMMIVFSFELDFFELLIDCPKERKVRNKIKQKRTFSFKVAATN
jgi:hypothetical protein